MVTKIGVELKNFFIFNSNLGPKEGEELKKILFYYPVTDNNDQQIKNVGLVEGIIQFTRTFQPSAPVSFLHTSKTRQLYFEPEKDFWVVMTLNLPSLIRFKEDGADIEKLEDDVLDNVYEAVLKQTYYMYRLFHGTFNTKHLDILKTNLETFYTVYLNNLKIANADILNIFNGMQYLPLDTLTFLKVQSFINLLETSFPLVQYTSFLYNEHIIWSGVEPFEMHIIYQYLIGTLLLANMEAELQGGSMPRNSSSPFGTLHHGRFITGPTNLVYASRMSVLEKTPQVHVFHNGKPEKYNLIVYRMLSCSVCMFINAKRELPMDFFRRLDSFMTTNLGSVVSGIADYCYKEATPSANLPEHAPKFIYFNNFNLAYKSTVHLDNKQTGNLTCSKDCMKIMSDMKAKNNLLGYSSETIVKTTNDFWVVSKVSNSREFYIVLQQKHASLIEVSDEVKKLCDTELKGIFFHPS